ncbi:MAG: DUF1501 domain-containing protein, partial [Planctomycetaceae bacterium]
MPENSDHPPSALRMPSRRSSLQCGISALTAFAGLPSICTANRPGRDARPRSCILLWLDGGPSHLEMFDPKPTAPAEVRGPFETIQTAVPGISICSQLPRT